MLLANSKLLIAILAGACAMIGWGLSDFFSSKAMKKEKMSEEGGTFSLYAITTIILWIAVISGGQPIPSLSIEMLLQLVVFAILNALAYLLFFHALKIGSLSTISTIFSTYAIGATVVSILFFGEQTNIIRIISLAIIFFGIIGVSIQNIKKLKVVRGFYFAIAAAVLLAIFFPFLNRFLGQQVESFFWPAVVDTIVTIIFLGLLKTKKGKYEKKITLTKTMVFAAIANATAIIAITWGLKATSLTSVVIVVSSAVPLVSATLGYIIFKEKLSKTQYIGIMGILLGTTILFVS